MYFCNHGLDHDVKDMTFDNNNKTPVDGRRHFPCLFTPEKTADQCFYPIRDRKSRKEKSDSFHFRHLTVIMITVVIPF